MRKSRSKPISAIKHSMGMSTRKVAPIKGMINVQTATFKEMDEEYNRLNEKRAKLRKEHRKALEASWNAEKLAFSDMWHEMLKQAGDDITSDEQHRLWTDLSLRLNAEYDKKRSALDDEYNNKVGIMLSQMMPIKQAITERFIKPELRRNINRKPPIPLTEFRNMVEGGSFGVTIDLQPDQRLLVDLDKNQLEDIQRQTKPEDIMDSFIYTYGYTKNEEKKYDKYLDWSYLKQYETIGGQGIDPEMDFWIHANQSAGELISQRYRHKLENI